MWVMFIIEFVPLPLSFASLDALSGMDAAEADAGGVEDVDATAPCTTDTKYYHLIYSYI